MTMEKAKYESPSVLIFTVQTQDIITTSTPTQMSVDDDSGNWGGFIWF